jgi:hypothetical protein
MKVPLTFGGVVLAVTGMALVGMVLGGLFGLGAGHVAPQFFAHPHPHALMGAPLEPVGAATVMGAMWGVLLGGGLGVFAVAVQALADLRGRREGGRNDPARPS